MYYNARWYDPYLNHFTQPDTIVPAGVQGYDRYAYVRNNPVKFNDPTGHKETEYSPEGGTNVGLSGPGDDGAMPFGASGSGALVSNVVVSQMTLQSQDMYMQIAGKYIIGYTSPTLTWFSDGFGTSHGTAPNVNLADAVGSPDCMGCGFNGFGTPNDTGYIFMTRKNYDDFKGNYGKVGTDVFITDAKGAAMAETATSAKEINSILGTTFRGNSTIVRIEIPNISSFNPRLPTSGNRYFVRGGYTVGGAPERVIDSGIDLTGYIMTTFFRP